MGVIDGRNGRRLRLAILLALCGCLPTLGHAQDVEDHIEDHIDDHHVADDPAPARAVGMVAPKSAADEATRGHAGGGDDAAPQVTLRGGAGTSGLALDQSNLPGELGATPEESRPLFNKSSNGLALRPDPWEIKPK